MKIKLLHSNGPLNSKILDKNQGTLSVIFPDLYKRLIIKHDYPVLANGILNFFNTLLTENTETIVCFLDTQNPSLSMNVMELSEILAEEHEQPGLVPFAQEAFGDMICFDYRGANRHSDDPPVVYWNHEFGPEEGRNPCPLAPNFLAFMQMLQPNPDEPPSDDAVEVEI